MIHAKLGQTVSFKGKTYIAFQQVYFFDGMGNWKPNDMGIVVSTVENRDDDLEYQVPTTKVLTLNEFHEWQGDDTNYGAYYECQIRKDGFLYFETPEMILPFVFQSETQVSPLNEDFYILIPVGHIGACIAVSEKEISS